MALEACFHVSTVAATTRASCVLIPFSAAKEKKLSLSTFKGGVKMMSSSSFSSSSDDSRRRHRSGLVCRAGNAIDEVQVVNESSWESLVGAPGTETPVLVEFWAPWCGPCRMIAPVIDELAKQYAGKILCYKLNTDESPNIASQYGIRSIPTVLFFKNGEKKESVIGAVPKSTLTATIEKYLDL
ncbi:hypothetical protein QJS10_CPA02g00920 [Acorus calamus]|uniref:Thioredoxin domain-containing protein n=1 Tax=Acorus calamus TaxID=4465 RepID=A0AAV9FFC4_ACOCL|nr:hypothetical protein QJS10_CPA02g00920 [Acorus calamus]